MVVEVVEGVAVSFLTAVERMLAAERQASFLEIHILRVPV
jgi:hypothetical protein